jgi:hypothetical protein
MTMLRGKVTTYSLSVEVISGVKKLRITRWNSIVDVVVGLWVGQKRNCVLISGNGKELFYLQSFQISSGTHTAFCAVGTLPGREIGRYVKATTDVHTIVRLGMDGFIPPRPYTPS